VDQLSIQKPPEAQSNTFLAKVAGVRTYGQDAKETDFEVRFTSDVFGESLSLTYGSRQWIVPFEPVEKLVSHTQAAKADTDQPRKICGTCQYYESPSADSFDYSCRLLLREKTNPYDTCDGWLGW